MPNYGKPTYPITVDGNGREQVEAHLTYFDGSYWMHAATWGCGGSLILFTPIDSIGYKDNYPDAPTYPPGDYGDDGNCGIKSYSSPDLVNWTLRDFYQPDFTVANVTKPVVRFSNATGEYVMFMGGNGQGNFFYATSTSPAGPWSNPPSIMEGSKITHDFDIAVGPDGTHYILTDPFTSGFLSSDVNVPPVWDIYVQQLAPNLTSTVNSSFTLVRSAQQVRDMGLTLEACGFFYHDAHWYLTFGKTCRNCAGYIYYMYADNPLGPYIDGGFISLDGCGGQNKGANVLPSANGPVVLAGNLGYKTGPDNLVIGGKVYHADNQQAASSTFFFPLKFNADHTIKNMTCPALAQVPLVAGVPSPDDPVPYQLDCRVRNWQTVIQMFEEPKAATELQFPVWQRTDNLGPTSNAGPVLNGPLNVTVGFDDGDFSSFVWAASNVSWAPSKIFVDVAGRMISSIKLDTNATNGCYGTLAQPNKDSDGSYGVIVQGRLKTSPLAQLYVYQY
ncbi:hypothetical protein Sste5346_009689 [Sporothrix stenoceras]|uniref:Glycoside hydrolase family 43 protein n=1 Tax=Sporothrix stenoceras TaxID=5173 RepID=A0ABR3YJK3_9PEZI